MIKQSKTMKNHDMTIKNHETIDFCGDWELLRRQKRPIGAKINCFMVFDGHIMIFHGFIMIFHEKVKFLRSLDRSLQAYHLRCGSSFRLFPTLIHPLPSLVSCFRKGGLWEEAHGPIGSTRVCYKFYQTSI